VLRAFLKSAVPLLAVYLLDRYLDSRTKHKQRKERSADLTRWEGEGGAVTKPRPAE
jgi:hypothetical protein